MSTENQEDLETVLFEYLNEHDNSNYQGMVQWIERYPQYSYEIIARHVLRLQIHFNPKIRLTDQEAEDLVSFGESIIKDLFENP